MNPLWMKTDSARDGDKESPSQQSDCTIEDVSLREKKRIKLSKDASTANTLHTQCIGELSSECAVFAQENKDNRAGEEVQEPADSMSSIGSDDISFWDSMGATLLTEMESSQGPAVNEDLGNTTTKSVETGFTTGSNKKVFIDEEKLRQLQAQLLGSSQDFEVQAVQPTAPPKPISEVPEEECYMRADLKEDFSFVLESFPRDDERWLRIQFRWAWLHFWVTSTPESQTLFKTLTLNRREYLIEQINLRKKTEESILRRIAEFDESPCKYMVLGVLNLTPTSMLLYDGFYSVDVIINEQLFRYLNGKRCTIGTKLHVFGAERLITEPTDILELRRPLLKLSANSVRVTNGSLRLGAKKAISFLTRISEILPGGGVVSALFATIRYVISRGFKIQLGDYFALTDDPESEIEKISQLLEKSKTNKYTLADIRILPFVKVRIADESGECDLTWWQPPEITVDETYKFIYLKPITGPDIHLVLDWRGCAERIG